MKRLFALVLIVCLLTGCGAKEEVAEPAPTQEITPVETVPVETAPLVADTTEEIPYVSRFDSVQEITLSDEGILVNGAGETDAVYTSRDIIYYEDMDAYDSGYPYGEGEASDRHSADEAAAHTVVNITEPGAYRVSGKLSLGQIRVDLGATAYDNEEAVVELILSDADITCTVAPAVIFMNVYECDNAWSADNANSQVDTSSAGANLILEGTNTVTGSHVAKIFKDKEGEKKLWKQDGAIYSYMSMNVYGPGKLDLNADNEGLDTELHLTINGGDIAIRSDNDGINTNEDGVSVTTINAGNVHIIAGLGAEGDGIDSNGYLVINGGTVVSSANPMADAGLDSDLGSFVNGGTVIAMGSTMDWAESDSQQVTMNLQFAGSQSADAAVVVTRQDGAVIFAYDPSSDEVLAENKRVYSGAVISCGNLRVGETYHVYVDGEVTGTDVGGIYDVTTVTGFTGGTQMRYTGTDVRKGPGGMGFGGGMPGGFDPNNMPEGMEMPEDFDLSQFGEQMPEGGDFQVIQFEIDDLPEDFDPSQFGGQITENGEFQMVPFEGGEMPEGFDPSQFGGQRPEGGEGQFGGGKRPEGMENFDPQNMEGFDPGQFQGMGGAEGEPSTEFYMSDKVNAFSGVASI